MATPNIVPRADSEGGLGTASKYWASAYIDLIYVGAGKVGRDADNLIDFSTDNQIDFRVAAGHRLRLTQTSLAPITTDSVSLGTSSLNFSDLFLDSGAVINFDNGDVTLTHASNALTLDGGHLQLTTNFEARFGSSNRLRIYSDNTDGYIQNTATDGDIIFQADNGSGTPTAYLTLDGSRADGTYTYTTLPDNGVMAFGANIDLQVFHDSTNSRIENNTGELRIVQKVDDGDLVLQCDDGSGGVTAYLTLDGSANVVTAHTHISYIDHKRAYFGTGYDLEIYHNASNSIISHLGTGDLYIQNTQDDEDIIFQCDDGAGSVATYFYLDGSSATHDGSATTGLYTNWPDKSRITVGTSHDFQINHDSTDTYLSNNTGNLTIQNNADDKDISFRSDDGSGGTTEYFKLDGSQATHDGSATTALATVFPDNSKIHVGSGSDGRFWHDGSHTYLQNTTGNLIIQNFTDDGDILFKSDDGSGGTTTYLTLDGGFSVPYVALEDSAILALGTHKDLLITHDGTDSKIDNMNTGDLKIRNFADDKDIIFESDNGSGGTTAYITLDGSDVSTIVSTIKVMMPNLPTSDPSVAGQLWNDSGTLKISAG